MNDLSLSRRPEVPHSTTIPQQHGPSQSPAIPTQSSGGLVPTCCDDNGYYSSPLQMHCNFHVPLLDWGSRGCGFNSCLVDDPEYPRPSSPFFDLVAADNGGGSGGGWGFGADCRGSCRRPFQSATGREPEWPCPRPTGAASTDRRGSTHPGSTHRDVDRQRRASPRSPYRSAQARPKAGRRRRAGAIGQPGSRRSVRHPPPASRVRTATGKASWW